MKLIISENQYRRLLERKNSKTIIVTESQYNKLINEQFSPIRVPYEVRSKLTPILKSLLLSVSVIYMNNKLKGGVKEVDLVNGNVKLSISGKNIDKELFNELDNPKYNFEIENLEINDEAGVKTLNVDYKDRGDRRDVVYVPPKTFNVDNIITVVRKKVPEDTSKENLDSVVRDLIKKENPAFYEKVKDKEYFIRYCFPHFHKGIDVGGKSELGKKIVFKKPFTVIDIGKTCFVLKDNGGKFHRFCHCKNVGNYIKKDKTYLKGNVIGEVGNIGFGKSSTAPHVHYEIGSGNRGNKLTGHEDPENVWKDYWGVMNGDFKEKNGRKTWTRIDLNATGQGFGKRIFDINSKLCKNHKKEIK
jgi:hypothetical protein